MKKILTVFLSLAMMLLLFAGCAAVPPAETTGDTESTVSTTLGDPILPVLPTEGTKVVWLKTDCVTTNASGMEHTVISYDGYGREMSKEVTGYGNHSMTTYTYDQKGFQNGYIINADFLYAESSWVNDEEGRALYGTEKGEEIITFTYQYDEKGREISYVRKNGKGETIHEVLTEFTDENGSSIRTETSEGILQIVYTVLCDEQGRKLSTAVTYDGKQVSFTEYDEHENPTKIVDEEETFLYVNTYDENGMITASERQNDIGELQMKTVYTYDAAGNPKSVVITDATGKEANKEVFTYMKFRIRLMDAE